MIQRLAVGTRTLLFETVPACLMVIIVGVLVSDVFGRYVLNSPIIWAPEVALLSFIWLVYLGAVGVSLRRGHIAVDVVTSRLSDRPRAALSAFAQIVTLAVLTYLAIFGVQYFLDGRFTSLAALGLSKRYIELAIPISAIGMAAVALVDLWSALRGVATGEFQEHVEADDSVDGIDSVTVQRGERAVDAS